MTAARRHLRNPNGRRGPRAPCARRAAFSLAELILALGVLAIGMAMAAALFPAAIKLNEQSTRDSVGTIIAQNGLAIARVQLTCDDLDSLPDPNNLACVADEEHNEAIPLEQQRYPNDPSATSTKRGFLVLGRRLSQTYQLVIVSYDKVSPNGVVTAKPVTIDDVNPDTGEGAVAVRLSPAQYEQCVGSPLIFANEPGPDPNDPAICYPRIVKYDKNLGAILDQPIDQALEGTQAFVIVEDGGQVKKNPVMTVLVAETTLRD